MSDSTAPSLVASIAAAKTAGLVYVTDDASGIRRIRNGKGFYFVGPNGRRIRAPQTLARIRSMAIPPAWTQVWICPNPSGHVQATGRDARGRKQYRYHSKYRAVRDESKYTNLVSFAQALPRIRDRVRRDLALRGLVRERLIAAVIRLLDLTSIRIGNEEYAEENGSYGITTLRSRHVRTRGSLIRMKFRGKSAQMHEISLNDPVIAAIVKKCQDLPGQELFQYLDEDGESRPVTSTMVNDYLREVSGFDVTAKHFRTWHGTLSAAVYLAACEPFNNDGDGKHNVVAAVKAVAEKLGNRPATCRKHYISPAVLDAYGSGSLCKILAVRSSSRPSRRLSRAERCLLAFLRKAMRSRNGKRVRS